MVGSGCGTLEGHEDWSTVAPMTEPAVKRKSRWKRGLRFLAWGVLGFLAFNILLILFLRFVPPPVSSIRIQRRVASWFEPGPYTSRHAWKRLEDISPSMGLAVIAAEDQNFPEHSGFDWQAIEKALAHNEKSRRKRGASTVSQQTAKNLFCWESRSYLRKGAEAWFTLLIELGWSKRRILEVYLNIVEFGDGIFGVEAASQAYFRKPAKRLTPSECALLAAVLPNPHRFKANAPSPYIQGRQAWILRQMQQLGGEAVVKELGK
jgi:monofunctional biosynthetic peptidoglycan transglycosylase